MIHISVLTQQKMRSNWQLPPKELPLLDIRWLFQDTFTVASTPEDVVTSTTALLDEVK